MADREFVFGRADVQKLLRDHFVTVAADDWYQRRQDDPVGEFFRAVADQGPRKGAGGSTRQGRYAFTASGRLLGFNNNRDPERILRMLNESIEKFEALPAEERAPGAVSVPALDSDDLDDRYARIPPKDGLVMKVHARVLEQDDETGRYTACRQPAEDSGRFRHKGFGAATDHLWIKADEAAALVEALRNGQPVPASIAMRIARFHLVDNTRGEPPHWRRNEVRRFELVGSPAEGDPHTLRLAGGFHLETQDGERGYTGQIAGFLAMDPQMAAVTRFDLVAVGTHWGEGPYTRGARPGKTPFGVAFTLANPDQPEDRVPPQGIRSEDGYYRAESP